MVSIINVPVAPQNSQLIHEGMKATFVLKIKVQFKANTLRETLELMLSVSGDVLKLYLIKLYYRLIELRWKIARRDKFVFWCCNLLTQFLWLTALLNWSTDLESSLLVSTPQWKKMTRQCDASLLPTYLAVALRVDNSFNLDIWPRLADKKRPTLLQICWTRWNQITIHSAVMPKHK